MGPHRGPAVRHRRRPIWSAVFETIIHPRVSETDAVGHINNTVVPIWFEAARRDLFAVFGTPEDFSRWRMIVASFTVNFEHELTYPAPVTARVWVERIGNSSLTLHEELHQHGKRCAVSNTNYVNVNPDTKRPERVSDEIRLALQPHLLPAPDLSERTH